MDLKTYLEEKRQSVDLFLDEVLPSEKTYPEPLHEAMRYSLFAGGKRLRPILVIAGFEAAGGKNSAWLLPVAASLELIHTYSLIHDDLPAMDNDDYRRGKPTNHKVFGEAMAILAGDALLTLAFHLISGGQCPPGETAPRCLLEITREVSWASGVGGMVGGQAADILATGKTPQADLLEYIHRHKTAALIRASVRSGAILAGTTKGRLESLSRYGENIGLAFQIVDDILDVEGNLEEIGKDVGSDQSNGKNTYPDLHGLPKAKRMANLLVEEAVQSLKPFGPRAEVLENLAYYITERRK